MTSSRLPQDVLGLHAWATEYQATYGLPPMAGGDTPDTTQQPTGDPAAAAPPPTPLTPDPGAAGDAGAEAATGGDQPQGEIPPWAQTLSARMDDVAGRIEDIAPQQPAGPGLVDLLGGADPAQAQQNGQQAQEAPQAQNGEQGLPADELGGEGPSQQEIIQQYIDSRAKDAAREMLQPYVQSQEASRIRDEGFELLENYPELRDNEAANTLMGQAQQTAQDLGIPGAVREPGFLELVHLAGRQLAAQRSETPAGAGDQQQQAQPGGVQLESGNGANPGPAGAQSDDLASRIVSAGGSGLGSFWGGSG